MATPLSPIQLGVLTARKPLRKREQGDGSLSSNPQLKYFSGLTDHKFADILELGEFLTELVEDPFSCPTTATLTVAGKNALDFREQFRRKFKPDLSDGYDQPHVETTSSQVLLIDLDGIVVGDERWRDDLAVFAKLAVKALLPTRFHDVTFWASLSASAGIKRSDDNWVVGLHVVFVADRPLDGAKRKALVEFEAPSPLDGAGKLDGSTLRCTQMYFTARPEFLGRDPAPIRATMVPGNRSQVALEEGLEQQLRLRKPPLAKNAKIGSGPSPGIFGYNSKMNLLGDGPGLGGFHEVIRDAIFAVAAVNGSSLDVEALKSNIRKRIDAAPKDESRSVADVDRYKSDSYLEDSIRGAMDRVASESFAQRAYELPTGTIAVAREDLSRGIEVFKDHVLSDYPRDIHRIGPNEWEQDPPFVMGIETPTGSGKTREAIALAVQLLIAGKRPVISAPNHRLCEEIACLLRDRGVSADVYRGLSAPDPDSCVDHDDEALRMCRASSVAVILRKVGMPLTKICEPCPYKSKCGYHLQMAKKKNVEIWVIPHALLAHERPKHTIGPCNVLIVDEDPIDAFLMGFGGQDDFLNADMLRRRAQSGQPICAHARHRLANMIEAGNIDPSRFPNADVVKSAILKNVNDLRKQMPPDRSGQLNTACEIVQLRFEAAIWTAIAAKGIGLKIEVAKQGTQQLRLFRRGEVTKDWTVPTLILDATPEWDAYEQFWLIQHKVSISADMPNAFVRQIMFSASSSKLNDSDTGQNNIGKILRYIEARSPMYHKILVVGQLRLIENLKQLGLPRNIDTVHFNALRGLDEWGDVGLLIVIGRTEPPPPAMEDAAEVLFREQVNRLPEGAYYPRAAVGLNTRTEECLTPAVMATSHPDPKVELLRRRAVQSEIIQAIGRGRGGNRTEQNPLNIDIINEVPLPIAIDAVTTWEDAQPSPAEVIAGRHGIFIDNPRAVGASQLVRVLLPDTATSRTTQYRKATQTRSLFQSPIEKSPKAFETVRAPTRPGRLLRAGGRYAIDVRFEHGVWRQLYDDEVPPPRAKQRRFNGRIYVLAPIETHARQICGLYFGK